MDLLDLMGGGDDSEDRALDRLEDIVALYGAEEDEVAEEALTRAVAFCVNHWGEYRTGMDALAARVEDRGPDMVEGGLRALRLREEGEEPGMMIRAARARLRGARRDDDARREVIARYGGEEAARRPTAVESLFIAAAAHLAATGGDPYGPLAGWCLDWHPLPPELREAVTLVRTLPATVTAARAETLDWDMRKRDLAALGHGPGAAVLPTACAARHVLVEGLWRRDLTARSAEDLAARLEYWATRGGDDGSGYRGILDDLRGLMDDGALQRRVGEASGDAARRLKAAHPDWSLARIGRELGISRQAVHKHLKPGL